jgi:branched-chain amino acid aminotransferase
VITPQVTDGVLEGITRRTVMDLLARERGLAVLERTVDRTELLLAGRSFLAGTGIGIVPVTRLDNRSVGSVGRGAHRERAALY